MSASARRRWVWPIAVVALASTMAAWSSLWAGEPGAFTPPVTGDPPAWESPLAPPPESSVAVESGGADTRGSAWERLACGTTNERIANPAPGATPQDRSLRPYPSRASPV